MKIYTSVNGRRRTVAGKKFRLHSIITILLVMVMAVGLVNPNPAFASSSGETGSGVIGNEQVTADIDAGEDTFEVIPDEAVSEEAISDEEVSSDEGVPAGEETAPDMGVPAGDAISDETVASEEETVAEEDISESVTAGQPVEPMALSGSVALSSLKIGPAAAGPFSDSATGFNTYVTQVNRLTLEGVYNITQDGTEDALIEITLQNIDHTYFDRAPWNGNFNYFSTSDGYVNLPTEATLVGVETDSVNGTVTVCFAVSGNTGTGGSFSIGYAFDSVNFGGWISDGVQIAEITVGGHVGGDYTRTVTANVALGNTLELAHPVDNNEASLNVGRFFNLAAMFRAGGASQLKLEPGTDVTLTLYYPDGAEFIFPADAGYGVHGIHQDNGAGELVFPLGAVGGDGMNIPNMRKGGGGGYDTNSYYYVYSGGRGIQIVFPDTEFTAGTTQNLTARVEYTPVGSDTPQFLTQTIDFYLVDKFIHMNPFDSAVSMSGLTVDLNNPAFGMYANAGDGKNWKNLSGGNLINAGTLPVPNAHMSILNDMNNTGKPAYINGIYVQFPKGTYKKADIVVTIKTSDGEEVRNYTRSGFTPTGTGLILLAGMGVTLAHGEYVSRIDVYPLDDSAGEAMRALPVNAEMHMMVTAANWPSNNFYQDPAKPVRHLDKSPVSFEVSWDGESKILEHNTSYGSYVEVIDSDAAIGGKSVVVRSSTGDFTYYHTPIAPSLIISLLAGENAAKSPGQTIQARLSMQHRIDACDWPNPVIYYTPPAGIEMDTSITRPVTSASGGVVGTAVFEETTLNGKKTYKITIDGLAKTSGFTLYYIDLTLNVTGEAVAGIYRLYSTDGISGLLFGTTDTPHSTPGGAFMDTADIDNNARFWGEDYTPALYTGNGPEITIASLAQLDVTAEMWNDKAGASGEWQNVNSSSAEATIETKTTGQGQFRLIMKNSGNSYIGDIKLLDILPHTNSGASNQAATGNPPASLGSQWTALLANGLSVQIFNDDANVTSSFSGWSTSYSFMGNPSYGNGAANTINRTDGDPFSGNTGTTAYATARAFEFLSNTFRLPPEHTIVLTGTVKAPAGVTEDDNGKVSYNSFAVEYSTYTAATGGIGSKVAVTQPNPQKFTLVDAGDAAIIEGTNSGFVFKDFNNNDVYDAGTDVAYADVTVELYRVIGGVTGSTAYKATTTDADGKYEFTDLYAGDYAIKAVRPVGASYSFVARSVGNTASHVDADGFGAAFTLAASEQKLAPTNAGIKATGKVTVRFKENGAQVGSDIETPVAMTADTVNGSITAGTPPYAIPQYYELAPSETAAKNYSLVWGGATAPVIEYAVVKQKYAVTYSYSGAVPAGAPNVPSAESVAWGETTTVAANPELDGYTFTGWNASGATISGGSFTMPKNSVTLSGSWSVNSYDLTFDLNDTGLGNAATGQPEKQTINYGANAAEPSAPESAGYTFGGWYEDQECTDLWDFADDTMPASDKTLYAKWVAKDVAVVFYLNYDDTDTTNRDAVGEALNAGRKYDDTLVAFAEPTREEYDFTGWYTQRSGGNEWKFATDKINAEPTFVLYAQWRLKTYSVTYTPGAQGAFVNDIHENVQHFSGTPEFAGPKDGNNPTGLSGYEFIGWEPDIAEIVTGDAIYTAQWIAKTYPVTYNANGGAGATSGQTATYGQNLTLRSNGFTREGYTFTGWNTEANGSGASYGAGQQFAPWITDAGLTLYAQWQEISATTYTVTYAPGAYGTFTAISVSGLLNGAATPNAPTITGGDGWVFTGWSPAVSATVTGNVTYTAQWRQNVPEAADSDTVSEVFTVRFVDWDGVLLKEEQVVRGGDATAPVDPTRAQHSFYRWDVPYTNIQGNLTVTALYVVDRVEDPGAIEPEGSDGGGGGPSNEEILDTLITEEGIDAFNIGGQEVPLSGGSFGGLVWALVNLILAIIGILVAIVTAIFYVRRRKDEEDDEYDEYMYEDEDKKSGKQRRLLWFFVALVMGVAGIVLFFLTEDMTRLMVLFDNWTIVNAAILFVEMVGVLFAFKRRKEDQDDSVITRA